ncbi:MAG: DNA recombination protein RmuC, partial [Bacteroidales bacterium]|nr:DNA recombination protein RmuC [Bacteroidales bacterium]
MITTIVLILIGILLIINLYFTITIIRKPSGESKYDDLKVQIGYLGNELGRIDKTTRDEFSRNREEIGKSVKENREELASSLKSFQESFTNNVKEFNELQRQKFNDIQLKQQELNNLTESRLEKIRETIEGRLRTLQEDNAKKLEEMRATVDEKLQTTIEKRFSESFKMISERLEQVHKGLGEMQNLASGVGDLKKVLTNVKTRGTLGEIQLGAILEQILSSEQYVQNATVKPGSSERIEFAVKLPGGRDSNDKPLLLPIDSKFPIEDYQRLMDAYDNMVNTSPAEIEAISKQFENAVRKNAKDIRDKYINPPHTTDFAIMFVPTEGLYAEILRRTGLFELLRRDFNITVIGPSNLVAFLSSLQMGFRTLAIEKRSSEVWELLGAVKNEFGLFGDILDKTKKKLQEATNVI